MTIFQYFPGRIGQGLLGRGLAKAIVRRLGPAVPVLLALSLVTSGCASRVRNVLEPLAMAPKDTSRVTMLVATTRKPSEDPGKLYSGYRGTAISLNSVGVSIPPDRNRKIGVVQWPSRTPPNPQKEFAVTQVAKVQSEEQAFDWYRKNRNKKHQVVIFVRGFNNTYASASRRSSMTPEPMPHRSSSHGRQGDVPLTTFTTRKAPTIRAVLWRI